MAKFDAEEKLQAKGAMVYITRITDKDLDDSTAADDINRRVAYINKNFQTVNELISIHCNVNIFSDVG